ncbi:MAG TPA: ABC transporter substrate-binding protein [Xanthobacteraceae bacterium]|nr:ABC transporter substrate-binding protein [Xanthobacteraceae bacterium]
MSCCDEDTAIVPSTDVSRRSVLKGAALVTALVPAAGVKRAGAQAKQVKLAFCSQILCIVPYEVARAHGHWKNHGLDVELIYARGGNNAMQALVGGAVDYAATALDVAIQAYVKGAEIRRFATTGQLPLFALLTAPNNADAIKSVKDLEGKTVGVSALGQADHTLLLYLLKQAGADKDKVQYATMGVNILEALRQGQVDAGFVQEPALTILTRAGSRTLVNTMILADAQKHLGGTHEFMGVAVRTKEIDQRRAEMVALAKGLDDALKAMPKMKPEDMVGSLPKELLAGANVGELSEVLRKYSASLYPDTVTIELESSRRVADMLKTTGLIKGDADVSGLHDITIVGG